MYMYIDGWMDDLQFYVLFNNFSDKSGKWADKNERLVQWNPVYGWEEFASSERDSNPGPLDQ